MKTIKGWKEKCKKQLNKLHLFDSRINIAISFLFLLLLISILFPMQKNYYSDNMNGRQIFPDAIMENKKMYAQEFKCNINNLNGVGIKFSTYNIENKNGKIKIVLTDLNNNNVIFNKKVNLNNIIDNDIYYISFKEQKGVLNNTYKLELYYDEFEDNSLTYWYSNENVNYNLNYSENKEMYLIYKGYKNSYNIIWYILILQLFLYCYKICKENENEKES